MKKTFFVVFLILIVMAGFFVINLKNAEKTKKEAQKFNRIYEEYNTDKLNGLDITTVINKAINNNEKYKIEKDSEGLYLSDEMYSIKIYIKMIINQKTYPMEKIDELGMSSFVEYFADVDFKCTSIQYHDKTGRVSEMTFEATEY